MAVENQAYGILRIKCPPNIVVGKVIDPVLAVVFKTQKGVAGRFKG